MENLKYEKLAPHHLPYFYDIRFAVEENMVHAHQIQYLLRRQALEDINQGGGWICSIDGEYVGLGFGLFIPEALIGGLFVKPEWQSHGIGTALLARVTRWLFDNGADTLNLTTDRDSKAEHFYQSHGWTNDGIDEFGQSRLIKEKTYED